MQHNDLQHPPIRRGQGQLDITSGRPASGRVDPTRAPRPGAPPPVAGACRPLPAMGPHSGLPSPEFSGKVSPWDFFQKIWKRPVQAINRWRTARLRYLSWGPRPLRPYHITFTPRPGFALPWFRNQRVRWAPHHGLQAVAWRGDRWSVTRQLAGRSRVVGRPRN